LPASLGTQRPRNRISSVSTGFTGSQVGHQPITSVCIRVSFAGRLSFALQSPSAGGALIVCAIWRAVLCSVSSCCFLTSEQDPLVCVDPLYVLDVGADREPFLSLRLILQDAVEQIRFHSLWQGEIAALNPSPVSKDCHKLHTSVSLRRQSFTTKSASLGYRTFGAANSRKTGTPAATRTFCHRRQTRSRR